MLGARPVDQLVEQGRIPVLASIAGFGREEEPLFRHGDGVGDGRVMGASGRRAGR